MYYGCVSIRHADTLCCSTGFLGSLVNWPLSGYWVRIFSEKLNEDIDDVGMYNNKYFLKLR